MLDLYFTLNRLQLNYLQILRNSYSLNQNYLAEFLPVHKIIYLLNNFTCLLIFVVSINWLMVPSLAMHNFIFCVMKQSFHYSLAASRTPSNLLFSFQGIILKKKYQINCWACDFIIFELRKSNTDIPCGHFLVQS